MMKLNDFILQPKETPGELILTNQYPAFAYEDGKRTDRQEGYKLEIVVPKWRFEKLSVKVAQIPQELMEFDAPVYVQFEGLTFYGFFQKGNLSFAARASAVKVVTIAEVKANK